MPAYNAARGQTAAGSDVDVPGVSVESTPLKLLASGEIDSWLSGATPPASAEHFAEARRSFPPTKCGIVAADSDDFARKS